MITVELIVLVLPVLATITLVSAGCVPEPAPAAVGYPSSIDDDEATSTIMPSPHPCQAMMAELGPAIPVVYDIERKKCISTGFTNPEDECPVNMELQTLAGNETFGLCDCVVYRPSVYDEPERKCRLLYAQENCPAGQWLVYNAQEQVTCVENHCELLRCSQFDELALYKGSCVKLGVEHPDCNGQYLSWAPGEHEPACVPKPDSSLEAAFPAPAIGKVGASIPNLQCVRGTKWSALTEKCAKAYQFEFS